MSLESKLNLIMVAFAILSNVVGVLVFVYMAGKRDQKKTQDISHLNDSFLKYEKDNKEELTLVHKRIDEVVKKLDQARLVGTENKTNIQAIMRHVGCSITPQPKADT